MDEDIRDKCYRFLFENSMESIFLTSPDGKIHRANPSACTLFQRTEEELCGLGREGVVNVEDPRLVPALKERAETGHFSGELEFIKKDGTIFPAYCSSAIFTDDDGKIWTAIIIRDITESKRAREEALISARYDHLTGVYNRGAFLEEVNEKIDRSPFPDKGFSLMLMDMDYFKEINDNFGHAAGDRILAVLAECLRNNFGENDVIGRYGGDEFVIFIPENDQDVLQEKANKLLEDIRNLNIKYKGENIYITASIGIAMSNDLSGETLDSFISRADDNMYKAKKRRDCIYFA